MHLVMREAERVDDRIAERRAQQRPPVVPAALVPGQRAYTHPRQLVGETESMQDARGVGADLDAGADLADGRGLLVDVDVESRAQQRQRRGQAADAAADDRDRGRPPGLSVHPRKTLSKSGERRSRTHVRFRLHLRGRPAVLVATRG